MDSKIETAEGSVTRKKKYEPTDGDYELSNIGIDDAENGVAIVLDPKTGDVLASANWPSYEPYEADGTPAPIAPGDGWPSTGTTTCSEASG